jgi:hypothetical protein
LSKAAANCYSVAHQVIGDALQVQPELLGGRQHPARLVHVLGQGGRHMAMIAEGVDGLGRRGVDGVDPDQRLNVEHVGIGGVLGAGGSPKQPLGPGAAVGQGLPAGRGDHLQIALVGDLGVGDGDLAPQALQLVRAGVPGLKAPVDLLVDHAVDAADEETGDAVDARDVAALGFEVLQPRRVRLGDRQIGVGREEQGDVDVDPLADQLADGGDAGRRSWDLDHQIGTVDRMPQPARLLDGGRRVHRQIGRDLEADVAVLAAQAVVDRPEQVGGGLDVGDGEAFVEIDDLGVALGQDGLQPGVIGVALADGLLEDRGVGGEAPDSILLDQALELAVLEDLLVEEVEPDGLARLAELQQRIGQ